jgi:hypothetical protein
LIVCWEKPNQAFEKRSVVAKIILTQARFSSNNLAIIFSHSIYRRFSTTKQQLVVLEA